MTTACTEHVPIWADAAMAFECGNCGQVLETASGRCSFGHPIDAHTFFRNTGTLAEPVLEALEVPVCPGVKS